MDAAVVASIALLAGAFIGAGVARAATRSRVADATAALQAERTAVAAERDALSAERDGLRAERDGLRAERDAAAAERDRLSGERTVIVAERDQLRAERDAASQQLHLTSARLVEAQTLLKSQEQVEAQLTQTFARMSTESLQATHQQLLSLADDRFRQAGKPLNETLAKVEAQLREIEKDRAGAQRELAQQIQFVRTTGEQLKNETAALVNTLRKPQARGQWGELTLRRCLEHAGMLDRCDFVEQESFATSEGTLRPDLVVHLVGGKNIVVDAKVTLAAFLDAHEATDEATREERLTAHAKHLRQHVDSLAAKAYWEHLSPAPEFVVLFVPGDAFLASALDRDAMLLEDALRKRVHIATPTTLISVLRTVAYAWQQQALADHAREVFDLGKELHKRLGTMGGHVDKLGRSLTRAVNDYNSTVGSLESQVMSTARKLNEMNVVDEPLVELSGIDDTVRPLTKPELVASAEQARAVVTIAPSGPLGEDRDRLEDYGLTDEPDVPKDRRTGS
ncbi:MAG TPA: DNA recombination protein RmuC [Mycobacteriales bacterium]|nr:DNA recombination protein RmuC [Mycobacteriales bacterium]